MNMKAAVFDAAGKPQDVLSIREVGLPTPRDGEVLVRVDARPIQPADFMFIGGRYRIKPQWPQVAGLEGAGVVVDCGPGASVAPGRRVAFRSPGTWAEYVTVPAGRLHVAPEDIGAEDAAQFSLNPITAWALLDELSANREDWIAINAATSAVAQLVAGLARRRGVQVLGLVRADNQNRLDFVTLTADEEALSEKMLGLTGGTALAGLLDSIGGPTIMNTLPALRTGATIVSFGVLEEQAAPMRNADLIYRNLTWKGFGIDYWLSRSQDRHGAMVDELWDAIRCRDMLLPVRALYSLDDVQVALADAASTGKSGKILIVG